MNNIRKYGLFALIVILSFIFNNCSENSSITPENDAIHSTEIKISEYVDNYYFLDRLYNERFDSLIQSGHLFQSDPESPNNYFTIKDIELWKTTTGRLDISKDLLANTFVELETIKPDSIYSESYRNIIRDPIYGESDINQRHNLLDSTEYEVYPNLGVIRINFVLDKHLSLAVAYSIEGKTLDDSDDIIYGEFINVFHKVPNSVKIFKLIKHGNLSPSMTKVWPLQLRNIYNFNSELTTIFDDNFSVNIFLEDKEFHPKSGKTFLNLFNFDIIDPYGYLQPDGDFDYLPNKTINIKFSELIFPVLEPFGNDFPPSIEQQFQCSELYKSIKSEFSATKKDSIFNIIVNYNILE